MPGELSMAEVLRNMLQYGDLSFRDFMELALYHPELGYYSRARSPIGREGDFITGPSLSPVFAFAIGRLIDELSSRIGGGPSTIADIGCGDGSLIHTLYRDLPETRFFGVDRSLDRVRAASGVRFVSTLDELPRDGSHLLLSNELFDAFPFARLVRRGEHLHELWVTERDGVLDWAEHEAAPLYDDYFAERGIELLEGQFADISPEWAAYYDEMAALVRRGLIVTFDYGFEQKKLFDPRIRRFGTAASYTGHRVTRDLLANPGEQDLTAHINFTDLQRAGEQQGFTTLFFGSQAKFLLALGITEHELFSSVLEIEASVELMEKRDEARRLVLPDGIGEDIRVLVQGKGLPLEGWSFQGLPF